MIVSAGFHSEDLVGGGRPDAVGFTATMATETVRSPRLPSRSDLRPSSMGSTIRHRRVGPCPPPCHCVGMLDELDCSGREEPTGVAQQQQHFDKFDHRRDSPANTGSGSRVPLFAHYYLWWDATHWSAKLGPNYPVGQRPPPLPAILDATGCAATPSFPGTTLTDVPAPPLGLYSQDDQSTFATHIAQAVGAGVDGFVVSWSGNGDPAQSPSSTPFDRRLDLLVHAVDAHNARTGGHFALMLGYQGLDNSRTPRSESRIATDLDYFTRMYATDPAFSVPVYGTKPVVMVLDSRKFSVPSLTALLTPRRAALTLIGDEQPRC